jgi:hypothetical protein
MQEPVQLIPMMNLQQYVRYMKDAAAANGQDTSIARLFSTKQQYAIQNNISTDWQDAVLRDGKQASAQFGLNGSSPNNRFALSGNYFDQKGVIPGQGTSAAPRSHRSNIRRKISYRRDGECVAHRDGSGRRRRSVRVRAGDDPLGRPTNFTNPDSPACSIRAR